ncbi:hypothetical protein SC1083_0214 [Aggregatibacter actinomycetemcomitans serotype e str. SC1083]|uniref:YcgL domain-containing protein n=2 Tax=Aggregatibacter actinomycetemcomitans TaxID=714 RepID=G4A5X6_AGGAC|nr:hypothetical protein SC1083_0214 [Aggregatibacter actinomycetemcomitans serotype e str. SC1083]EHK90192.1 hypothetical protein RHAA1_05433 [Aggregatibacter actinomycetemcomitans RhAA1]KYK74529.1 hypothetical protein SA3096_05165 [Aggregatibacter actinomycetemcomitans serotype e str. SA3096]KYK96109.1 hypothetical protein ANH9776_02300 [Aggregatibacter actinomycetemcomitans serotype e str. ANH9776]
MYLYIEKRNQFDGVPEALLKIFGKPIFVMLFNLAGEKPLENADKTEVLQNIKEKGFYLQTPKKDDWLFSL